MKKLLVFASACREVLIIAFRACVRAIREDVNLRQIYRRVERERSDAEMNSEIINAYKTMHKVGKGTR